MQTNLLLLSPSHLLPDNVCLVAAVSVTLTTSKRTFLWSFSSGCLNFEKLFHDVWECTISYLLPHASGPSCLSCQCQSDCSRQTISGISSLQRNPADVNIRQSMRLWPRFRLVRPGWVREIGMVRVVQNQGLNGEDSEQMSLNTCRELFKAMLAVC